MISDEILHSVSGHSSFIYRNVHNYQTFLTLPYIHGYRIVDLQQMFVQRMIRLRLNKVSHVDIWHSVHVTK